MENDVIDPGRILPFRSPVDEHGGIVGISDDISMQRLYSAYMQGVFPWFDEDDGEPVVWYCPPVRFCMDSRDFHVPKSLRRFLKKTPFTYTMDNDFAAVIDGCRRMGRKGQDGTWIGDKMVHAYCRFHELGFAHSVEAWHDGKLAGGFYGVLIGSVFCGESMFTVESGSSKSAFALFADAFFASGGKLIDSQVYTDNIARYGAKEIIRDEFLFMERACLAVPLFADIRQEFSRVCGGVRP